MSLRLIDFIISSVRGSNQWKLSHFICQSFTRIVYKAVYLNSILGFLPRKFLPRMLDLPGSQAVGFTESMVCTWNWMDPDTGN